MWGVPISWLIRAVLLSAAADPRWPELPPPEYLSRRRPRVWTFDCHPSLEATIRAKAEADGMPLQAWIRSALYLWPAIPPERRRGLFIVAAASLTKIVPRIRVKRAVANPRKLKVPKCKI